MIILWSAMPVQVYASQPREIPYTHALTRATGPRNAAIAPLDRESRQANAQARVFSDMIAALRGANQAEAEMLYGQRLIAFAERDRLQRERDRLVFSTEISLRNHLANITGYELDIELLAINLVIQEQILEQLKLRRHHGMASDREIQEAEHTLEQTKLNLEMLHLTLQNERQQLNRLIHQPLNTNIRLIYDINDLESPPEGAQIDRFVQRYAAQDHTLLRWQEEVGIRRHEWQRQLEDPDVDNRYMRLQHQLATLERDMARRQAELNVRNALVEWDRLVERQIALEAELAQAQAEHENMKSRLEAGLVTQLQVDSIALALAAQEAELVRHNYVFWIASLRLEHPYIRIN